MKRREDKIKEKREKREEKIKEKREKRERETERERKKQEVVINCSMGVGDLIP